MPRLKRYEKHIACIESLWEKKIENRLSMQPLLELVSKYHRIQYRHLICSTIQELEFDLRNVASGDKYSILYLAFHGKPGRIELADGSEVSLKSLAMLMRKRFKGRVVHFGGCSILKTAPENIIDFLKTTGVSMVVGYRRDLHWIEGSAMDLLIFEWLQYYKNMAPLWERFKRKYPDMIASTGLEVYT